MDGPSSTHHRPKRRRLDTPDKHAQQHQHQHNHLSHKKNTTTPLSASTKHNGYAHPHPHKLQSPVPPPPPAARRTSKNDDNDDDEDVSDSSDELAAGSEHDEAEERRRRASWSLQKQKNVYTPQRPYRPPLRRSSSGSESPDELTIDAEEYWRSTKKRGSIGPQPQPHDQDDEKVSRDSINHDNNDDENAREDEPPHDNYPGDNEDEEMVNADDGLDVDEPEPTTNGDLVEETPESYPDRSPTPVSQPPLPPPKPDKVEYRAKFLLRGHLRGVSAVRFSPDASMIASGGADGAVKVWDTVTGKLIHSFEGHLAGISTISWSPDGATIASGSDDKTIRLWNVLTGKAHPIPFVGHHNYVYQIAFSPKGNMLVSGSYDEAVFLWDVRSAQVMRSLPAHSDPVGGIDVVWDGTLIASCATDGLIRIWDTASGQCLRTLVHEDNPPVTAVKFSPNGKYVLAWTLDDCVRLWDYVAGRCIKTYQGHSNRKYSLQGGFGTYGGESGNGSGSGMPVYAFAVSGSEDGAVLCWDVVSKQVLQRIEGHTGVVLGVDTCSLGGARLMVSCGLDGTVRVWEEASTAGDGHGPTTNGAQTNGTVLNGYGGSISDPNTPAELAGTEDATPMATTATEAGFAQTNGHHSMPEPEDTEMGGA
ncbi:WD40 repeat domain-containing protein [Aspergillus aculeatinus CBS 121060]|uniref:WD40 repeat-like protein n=1 Tax=Aspergillus aculeatinus CBS 121060 TaxID=1448322 RepID=A0ACD1HIF2_9EURO|nr:WD40 repeat-like protein [Aspergillus aculeatinus CBS 121060]RAH73361.1 WD40 repeat-like protein [Aspergillus aculeatinus CBS 121060]